MSFSFPRQIQDDDPGDVENDFSFASKPRTDQPAPHAEPHSRSHASVLEGQDTRSPGSRQKEPKRSASKDAGPSGSRASSVAPATAASRPLKVTPATAYKPRQSSSTSSPGARSCALSPSATAVTNAVTQPQQPDKRWEDELLKQQKGMLDRIKMLEQQLVESQGTNKELQRQLEHLSIAKGRATQMALYQIKSSSDKAKAVVEDNQALYGQLVQMLHEQKLVFEEQAMILRADENDLKLRDQDGSSQTLIDLNALRERFDELKGLVEQCDKQKEVISLLRRELDTRIGHQVDVEERARSLEATLSNTLTQLDNAVQRYDRLEEAQAARRGAFRSETDDLMAAIDQAQAECHKAHLDKEALAQQCSELKRCLKEEKTAFQSQQREAQEKRAALEEERTQLHIKLELMGTQFRELQDFHNKTQEKLMSVEQEQNTIRVSRDNIVEELAEHRHKHETGCQALQSAKESVRRQREEMVALRARCEAQEESLRTTQARFNSRQKDLDARLHSFLERHAVANEQQRFAQECQSEQQPADQELDEGASLKGNKGMLASSLKEAKNRLSEAESKSASLEERCQVLDSELQSTRAQIALVREETKDLPTRVTTAEAQSADRLLVIEEARKQSGKDQEMIQVLTGQISSNASTLSSVEQAKTASDESLKSKEAELLALKEASAKDQDKLRELVDLMQSLYARRDMDERILRERQSQLHQAESELAVALSSRDETQGVHTSLLEGLHRERATADDLKAELTAVRSQLAGLEGSSREIGRFEATLKDLSSAEEEGPVRKELSVSQLRQRISTLEEELRAATVHRNQQTARQLEAMRQEVLDLHEARRSDELVVVAFQIRMRQLAEAIQISRSEVQDMSNQHNAFLRQQFAIFRSLDVAAYDNQTPADVYRELKAAHMKVVAEKDAKIISLASQLREIPDASRPGLRRYSQQSKKSAASPAQALPPTPSFEDVCDKLSELTDADKEATPNQASRTKQSRGGDVFKDDTKSELSTSAHKPKKRTRASESRRVPLSKTASATDAPASKRRK